MDWERIARAEMHPLRLEILEAIYNARGPVSAVMIARERQESLGQIAHHVRRLHDAGLIVPAGTRQRRGAIEHLYRTSDGL
jgi:predicted transcriptional regulator